MLQLRPLDPNVPILKQLGSEVSPVVLINLFQVAHHIHRGVSVRRVQVSVPRPKSPSHARGGKRCLFIFFQVR